MILYKKCFGGYILFNYFNLMHFIQIRPGGAENNARIDPTVLNFTQNVKFTQNNIDMHSLTSSPVCDRHPINKKNS